MVIVIDAGHGGRDPGAVHKALKEKDINLKAAILLKTSLLQLDPNLSITFTRTSDTFITLADRVKVLGDLFVSLHCNSVDKPNKAIGFEVCCYSVGGKGGKVADSILSFVKTEFPLHGAGKSIRTDLYVLEKTKCPAVLLELGFLNNDKDLKLLTSNASLNRLLTLVALGILGSKQLLG